MTTPNDTAPDAAGAPEAENEFDLSIFSPAAVAASDDVDVDADADADAAPETETTTTTAATVERTTPETGGSEIERLTKALTDAIAAQQPRTPEPAVPAQEETFRFAFDRTSVPAPLAAMLNSEDPGERLEGLARFGASVANAVYMRVRHDVEKEYQPNFQGMIQQHYATQSEQANFRTEFFSRHPYLNTDQGKVIAKALAEQVMTERAQRRDPNAASIDKTFRDMLDAKIAGLRKAPATRASAASAAPARPAAPAAPSRSAGVRTVDPSASTVAQQILSVIG